MRDVFTKSTKDDRATASDGTFDHTGVEDGWADLVIIAQVCGAVHLRVAYSSIDARISGIPLVPPKLRCRHS